MAKAEQKTVTVKQTGSPLRRKADQRATLIGLLNAPATKIAGVLQAPAGQLARVFNAYATKDAA